MIPQGGSIRDARVVEVEQPSLTYRLDMESGTISGRVDGLEAVKQAVYKILATPRYQHLIYTPNYGHELHTLIGKDPLLVRSEAARMLREALLQDDRITAVQDVDAETSGDSILLRFTVVSRYGSFRAQQEVS
ncbi:DUF2634 domain-containing protein [Symbiobacterium terraclitae]|uniref:DUF2634 domain-containing protein n=1 Tax=Symbiobacterium terraclitae TaxID=557451 RepID=UPI0035B50933